MRSTRKGTPGTYRERNTVRPGENVTDNDERTFYRLNVCSLVCAETVNVDPIYSIILAIMRQAGPAA